MNQKIKNIIASSIAVKQEVLEDENLLATIDQIVRAVVNSFKSGFKVQFCGNGGSAADAQHLAAEFSGRFYKNRRALPSDALHCNSSYLTAVANDYSYDDIYARLVEGTMQKGDVLIGLSTSGNSGNIVKAFEIAREKGIITIGFTGASGGKLKALSDYLINIPSDTTPRIQEAHILVGHIVCELVEAAIFTD
ncbi:MAG: D-sedoheptulose 7-phosphate isomerase [Chitinophagaceae bacterium]|nr:D-sedoheptulose 7-phosphate isomerase [Chitinophagaceae bacterium]